MNLRWREVSFFPCTDPCRRIFLAFRFEIAIAVPCQLYFQFGDTAHGRCELDLERHTLIALHCCLYIARKYLKFWHYYPYQPRMA